jgi:uncharacterized protein
MAALHRERLATGPAVTGFSGRSIVIDGVARAGAVILTPLLVTDWNGAMDFGNAGVIDPPPEFILYGSGATLLRPSPESIAAWDARGITIETMDTRAAARVWTLLRAEGRWIVAALKSL